MAAAAFCNSLATLVCGEFDGVPLVLLGQLKPLVQLLLELAVANLLQDVRVPGLVNLECFPAVRADDFMHDYLLPSALALGLESLPLCVRENQKCPSDVTINQNRH